MKPFTSITGAAALLAFLAGTLPAAPALAESVYTCTCKGIPRYLFGFIPLPPNGCGNGFMGGDVGRTMTGLDADEVGSYLPPSDRYRLVQEVGGGPRFSDMSGWECRRE